MLTRTSLSLPGDLCFIMACDGQEPMDVTGERIRLIRQKKNGYVFEAREARVGGGAQTARIAACRLECRSPRWPTADLLERRSSALKDGRLHCARTPACTINSLLACIARGLA